MTASVDFTHALIEWYQRYGRRLPWRETTDPYRIWISEIMLQQTQVPRVAGKYYPHFLEKFPTVESLAAAKWDDVFPVWRGLGFYRRGKNLLKAAQMIVSDFEGEVPNDLEKLQLLPGVGAYTAAAVCSFAFDEKIPAIDTNIQKIVSTLWPGDDIASKAQALIDASPSGRDWNNAMMDLATALRAGGTIEGQLGAFFPEEIAKQFIPQRTKKAPLKKESGGLKTKKKGKKKRKHCIEVGIACIHRDGKYLIQTRPEGKSFVGHWEFPGGKREKGEDFRTCVKREIMEELGIEISVRPHFYEERCEFNHVDLLLRFHRSQIQRGEPEAKEGQQLDWVEPGRFSEIAFLPTNANALEKLQNMRV